MPNQTYSIKTKSMIGKNKFSNHKAKVGKMTVFKDNFLSELKENIVNSKVKI